MRKRVGRSSCRAPFADECEFRSIAVGRISVIESIRLLPSMILVDEARSLISAQVPLTPRMHVSASLRSLSSKTPDDWKEVERMKFVQKKPALPSGDSLEMKYIRQRLQRTAQGGRTSPRWSPVQGDHQLGLAALSPPLSPSVAPPPPSGPIPIQARPGRTPPGAPRMRNSVEGLNQVL
ncbi:hypothetical protein HPB51_025634 [Rhipicephalus microplus]|uniref:Uncharacterized protein n=1 Tax=Rhipicephalus microplus TaxID=6941 RepID=A0A9J6F6H1_RHIMP|nr:hypothetical protein HPB51_025634 [Rhipicephalus microplus]